MVLIGVFAVIPAMAQDAVEAPVADNTIKLLTIGNSFARDATKYLPGMAKAGNHDFLLFQANPGGCSMEAHAKWIEAHKLDPESPAGKPYPAMFTPWRNAVPKGKKYSLAEILQAEDWNYVTIQQLSSLSCKPETFEPYAKTIIDCIRENAPGAEILVHQTWAYREDYPGFADGTFTQAKMFDQLQAAYTGLAERYGLRVIPVGEAFQRARSTPRWSFSFPDENFDYTHPLQGTRPTQTGSLNIGWTVKPFKKKVPVASKEPVLVTEVETEVLAVASGPEEEQAVTGDAPVEMEEITAYRADLDYKHCNAEGRFIGSSVFYGFLFDEKASENPYLPEKMAPEDAVAIRLIADEVLAGAK